MQIWRMNDGGIDGTFAKATGFLATVKGVC